MSAPIGLFDLTDTLRELGIEPVSLTYERPRTSQPHWNLHVATCDEFRTLARLWRGKRDDREGMHGVRTLYADCGEKSLLGHCCHTSLPCWGSESGEIEVPPKDEPRPINDPDDYDGDLFGGDAA